MPRPRKPWTKTVEVDGVAVRLYAREDRGGVIYREVRLGGGAKDRASLHTSDRAHAVRLAEALARETAALRHAGRVGPLTVGQLVALYRAEVVDGPAEGAGLSAARRCTVRGHLALLTQHFRDGDLVADLSQHRVDAYAAARRAGTIASPRHRGAAPGVRAGTIRNELGLLVTMLKWARAHRVGGRPLLVGDPLEGVRLPAESNARRPVTTQARYEATLAQADAVDPRGRLRLLLVLARHTGRRINALVNLRASDVLRTRAQVEAALGALGLPVGHAAHWPYGALRFRAAYDKRQYDAVAPINAEARAALDAYLREHPRVGEAPLVPATADDTAPAHKMLAAYWLKRAEKAAGLPPLERGAWHAYRRLWASERRHLPAADVMAAGGWRSRAVMEASYQHADAATTYGVVALGAATNASLTPREKGTTDPTGAAASSSSR